MNYHVHDTKRGHVFETLTEARAYASMIAKKTGVIVLVTETKRKPTHVWEG